MGAFSLIIVVSYYIYIDIYIIMEGVVNVGTPKNAGSLVENVGNVVEAPSRPSRPRLLDEQLLEEVRRPLRMTDVDDGRQTDGRRLAPTRPSSSADLDHLRRPLGLVDDPSTPPRRGRVQQNSSRPATPPEPLTTTHTQQTGSVRRRLVRRRPLQAVDNLQSPTPSTSRVSNSPPPPPVKRRKTTTDHDDDVADETIDDDEY